MKVPGVEAPGHDEPDATHRLDARDDALDHGGAGRSRRLACCQRRRDRDAARMHDRVLARVVEVEPVSESRVGEHRVGGSDARRFPHQCALGRATESLGGLEHRAAEIHRGGGQTATERVEGEELGLIDHCLRNIRQSEAAREAGQTPRDRRRRHRFLTIRRTASISA